MDFESSSCKNIFGEKNEKWENHGKSVLIKTGLSNLS